MVLIIAMQDELIPILLKERARLTIEADPLRQQISELQRQLAAKLNDLGPIETLLKSRGWKPEILENETDAVARHSSLIPDYSVLALEWVKSAEADVASTRDFTEWLETRPEIIGEPNRDLIRNALKKLEKENYLSIAQIGQGRRPTQYLLHPDLA